MSLINNQYLYFYDIHFYSNEIKNAINEFDKNIIHEVFLNKTQEIQLPGFFLEPDEMFDIFMRISEDNLEEINKELESKFDTSQLKPKDTKYKSEQEQKEVFEKVKCFFK